MRLLVTGASSFVGAWTCIMAARRGHEVVGQHLHTALSLPGVQALRFDLEDPAAASLMAAQAPDVILHLAFKVKGSGDGKAETPAIRLDRRMMDAVLAAGRPVIYASSTCVHWTGESGYAKQRREDEARLAASGLPWAVVRPCAPFGPRIPGHNPAHKESFHTLAEMIQRSPIVPALGSGRALRQPVHVEDLGASMVMLAENGLPNKAFDAGGADALTLDEVIRAVARAAGKRVRPLHLPVDLVTRVGSLHPDFEGALLATADQDDLADPGPLARATGLWPRGFREHAGEVLR